MLLCSHYPMMAQEISYTAEAELQAMGGTEKILPFWMHSNSRGRLHENTHLAGRITGAAHYDFYYGGRLEIGGGIVYRNGSPNKIITDEAYLHFENSWMQATAGIKQQEDLFSGLSASNKNIFWSLNARPLPGLRFGTSGPLYFSRSHIFGIKASWADFYSGSGRNVEQVKIHHKSLHFLFNPDEDWQLKGGLRHFVQWGGKTANAQENNIFPGYIKAITGRQTIVGSNNHLGSWEGRITKFFWNSSVEFILDLPFESGPGAKLSNFPDGRYGIFWKKNEPEGLLQGMMYEFYTTLSQNPMDNYLSHPDYSGWIYHREILATPFFHYDVQNGHLDRNLFSAHHVGLSGTFSTYFNSYPYKILLTWLNSRGTFEFPQQDRQLFAYYTSRLYDREFRLDLQLGTEFSELRSPNYAAGVTLYWELK